MAVIEIKISNEMASKLAYIKERTGADLDIVNVVDAFVKRFSNSDGEVVLTDAWLLPSVFEYKAYANECHAKGIDAQNQVEWREQNKRKACLIDDSTTMLGQPYATVWDYERGDIIKTPITNISF